MRVFIDADGVLVNAVKGFCDVHNRPDPYSDATNYGIHNLDQIWSMNKKNFWANCGKEFWENLEPMPDARQILDLVIKFAGKDNITVLTKASNNDGCLDGKRNWFKKHFPELLKSFWVGEGSKSVVASSNSILIDDYDKNINEFRAAGGFGILLPRLWNSNNQFDTIKYLEEELYYFAPLYFQSRNMK